MSKILLLYNNSSIDIERIEEFTWAKAFNEVEEAFVRNLNQY